MQDNQLDLTADIIDVRDIIKRIETLDDEISGYDDATDNQEWVAAAKEHTALTAIMDDIKGNGGDEQWRGDWYPVTLIRDSYFNEYMDEMLHDCGELSHHLPPYLSITVDYEMLQGDYYPLEINGVTYWYR